MRRPKGPFKNVLCLDELPEFRNPFVGPYLRHLGSRDRCCQRHNGHKPPHRTYSREWKDGDKDSRQRV